jgi:hypothetical protein
MWNFFFGYELGKRPKIGYVTMKSKLRSMNVEFNNNQHVRTNYQT